MKEILFMHLCYALIVKLRLIMQKFACCYGQNLCLKNRDTCCFEDLVAHIHHKIRSTFSSGNWWGLGNLVVNIGGMLRVGAVEGLLSDTN